ncbi:Cytochrome P450 2A6 [Araneus ventricosus]|uniref:Cytochrome P450 2A6 n=1 Tax=Araneus ventricosus TaxID=182803 RepID=A0A4Y2BTP8_ARAVE|nr:Cytochrome P450 2A6 [Araneus ventricosus]
MFDGISLLIKEAMDLNTFYKKNFLEDTSFTTSGLLFVIASCVLFMVIHRIAKWYNLRKKIPPGPIGLPFVGYLPFVGKEPHRTFWNMRSKYGDIISVFMGPKYTVILNDYNSAKEVLCNPAALDRAPDLFSHLGDIGFIAENGEKWIEQRRYCLSATRDLGLGRDHWEDLIIEETTNFIKNIKDQKGAPTDISHILASSVTSNIISLLIGRRLTKDEVDKVQIAIDYSDVAFTYMGPSNPTSVVPGLRKVCEIFKIAGYDKAMKVIRQFSSFIRAEINRHKTSPVFEDVRDFINSYLDKLSELSQTNNKNHYFSEIMLEGNLAILFLGASDTIFSSLGWLYRLMCEHKDIQEKVHKELMEVIGKDGRARYDERNKIPYTFAVLMEAQRFASNVPLSTTRKANQDIHINGYVIPKGSEIIANLWALHHDPAYWDEPEEFRPERFLTDGGTKLVKHAPSFAPFSIGRRNCPGETIAWMEILFYFSETLKNFEISTPPGVEPEFNIINGLVARLSPQPLCFKQRQI